MSTTLSNGELDDLLFYSFRYALGRRTYVVSDVTQKLIHYSYALRDNTIESIKKEINVALEKGQAGMKMDEEEWKKVLEELE